ncbi:MAG: hypothetical protein CHACPFDD_02931 [Phycisphaerae bacterium]|nr:hypothetical protein [Phycisphaerae bacterium]
MFHLDDELARGYLRGELDAAASQRVSEHVAQCAACAAMLDEARSLAAVLKLDQPAAAAVGPSAANDQAALVRLLERVKTETASSVGRRRWRGMALGAAYVSLAVAGIVLWVLRPTGAVGSPAELARVTGVSESLQAKVVASLDALAALRADAWVADDYDSAVEFRRLLDERP